MIHLPFHESVLFREINSNRAERQFVVPIKLMNFVLSLAPYRLLYVFHFLSLGQKQELFTSVPQLAVQQ